MKSCNLLSAGGADNPYLPHNYTDPTAWCTRDARQRLDRAAGMKRSRTPDARRSNATSAPTVRTSL